MTDGVSMETSKKKIDMVKFYILFFHMYYLDISLLKNNSLIGSLIAKEYYSKRVSMPKSVFEINKNIKKSTSSPVCKLNF